MPTDRKFTINTPTSLRDSNLCSSRESRNTFFYLYKRTCRTDLPSNGEVPRFSAVSLPLNQGYYKPRNFSRYLCLEWNGAAGLTTNEALKIFMAIFVSEHHQMMSLERSYNW